MSTHALIMLLVFASASAEAPVRAGRVSVPVPARAGEPPGVTQAAQAIPCADCYSNIGVPNGMYFPAGAGVEVLDDLHLGPLVVTRICSFDFGYYKASPGLTDATVVFYANDPGDNPPGATLATFELRRLPSGENGFRVEVPTALLAQDVWLGVSFNTSDTGLQLAHPRWPGASDDWFLMRPPNQYFNFGGNPRSDFLLGIAASGVPVDAGPGAGMPIVPGFRSEPYPNPSSSGIAFRFAIRDAGSVRVDVLDVSGRAVAVLADQLFQPGVHDASWDGRLNGGTRAPAGVYLVRLTMPGFSGSRKFALIR